MKDTITIDGETYKKVKSTTNVHIILDNSGSMGMILKPTIDGYNEYLDNLKKDGGSYNISLVKFGNNVEEVYSGKSIDEVKRLTEDEYNADGGMTALYDAVGVTLKGIKNPTKGKHVVVVITDGGENASHEFNEKSVSDLKAKLEKGDNFTFVFLGANQDSWSVASRMGYAKNNVANYNATPQGMAGTWEAMSLSTMAVARSAAPSTKNYFSDEQKAKLENTK